MINNAVCGMTPSSSMHLDFNSFLAWQRIQFGDNPAGSKGFSRHPCHAFQGKYNKGHSTRRGHSLSATRYIPHSPVSSHSSVRLHSSVNSQLCKFTQPLHMQTAPYSPVGSHTALVRLCSMYLLYCSDSLQQLYTNTFFTVSIYWGTFKSPAINLLKMKG